ncbi:MAG: hypothetical protein AB1427_06605 [Thermodesulfobacteriota bacterium]
MRKRKGNVDDAYTFFKIYGITHAEDMKIVAASQGFILIFPKPVDLREGSV